MEDDVKETVDELILAGIANQTLIILDKLTFLERYILSLKRHESELHNHTVAHSDSSVLPENEVLPLKMGSKHIAQYGARTDNYEITSIMHNQQPWVNRSDKTCLVTYNPISQIDRQKIIGRWWFQHIVHDVRHIAWLIHLFRFIQGKRRTWHCGAPTLVNSQEICLVTGLAAEKQIAADDPFEDPEARLLFEYFGGILYGWRFKKARRSDSQTSVGKR